MMPNVVLLALLFTPGVHGLLDYQDANVTSLLLQTMVFPSKVDLQRVLEFFSAECGIKISTSNSKAMVLSQKRVGYFLQVWRETWLEVIIC